MKFIDQLHRELIIPQNPQRIVSLVPSQTELLFDLGLKEKIIGQTIFCVHPQTYFKSSVKIGGTKKLNIKKIISLKPDLIIANKEENEKAQIEELAEHFPVWISDVNTFDEALNMIHSLGEITGTEHKAFEIIERIKDSRNHFLTSTPKKPTAVYLIWNEPYIAVGKNTFINAMLHEAGFKNLVEQDRYPEISIDDLKELNPDFVLLSSEPFPFNVKHKLELDQILDSDKCLLVDGEMFSWYGSRMSKAFGYFAELQKF